MGRLSTTSVRDGFWDRLGGQDGVCWSWSVFQKLKKTLDDACWIKQYLQFDACLIFLLSVATILNLPACTQKIPEPLGRPSFLLLFSACELVSQIPRLQPSVDSDEHSLRRRTSPIGSSNPPFFPPPHPNPPWEIPDWWRITIYCLWLAAIWEVCFPTLWSTMNYKNN